MSVSTGSILAPAPRAPLRESDAAWLVVLEANFDQVRRECRRELASNHPGARHRVATLLALGANLSAQLAELDNRGGLA